MKTSNEANLFIHRDSNKQTTNVMCCNWLVAGRRLWL